MKRIFGPLSASPVECANPVRDTWRAAGSTAPGAGAQVAARILSGFSFEGAAYVHWEWVSWAKKGNKEDDYRILWQWQLQLDFPQPIFLFRPRKEVKVRETRSYC